MTASANGRITEGLQALYLFDEGSGSVVNDLSGVGAPLDLTIVEPPKTAWLTGSLALTEPTSLLSLAPAGKVISAAKTSGEVTLEAWLTPAEVEQSGPAQIISLAGGSDERNLSLGQAADAYELRLRTTTTSSDGLPSLATISSTVTANLSHVVYTRDISGLARLYLDGQESLTATTGGSLATWDESYFLNLGNEPGGGLPWLGELHLVAFYSRALSPAEVYENYEAGADPRALASAQFSAWPTEGLVPLAVQFSPDVSTAESYLWDFGDGLTSTLASPLHTYTQTGVYTVSLAAAEPDSQTITRSGYITVLGPAGQATPAGAVISAAGMTTVTLEFPPGAVTETLDIYIQQTDLVTTELDSDGSFIEEAAPDGLPFRTYTFTARRPNGTTLEPLQFLAPVTLTATYLPAEVAFLEEETLTFVYHNPVLEELELVSTTVQTAALQVTAAITHFSSYGVAGDSALWTSPTLDAFEVALARGQASTSYDIPLPAGPAGFGPKLTLQYSSSSINSLGGGQNSSDISWAGAGWSLELGEITKQFIIRSPKINNNNTVYGYNLVLNGLNEELLQKNSSEYHTRHQTFMKVNYDVGANRWTVVDTQGTTYYFGQAGSLGKILTHRKTENLPGGAGNCPFQKDVYKLYKAVDIHGNTMEIAYDYRSGADHCPATGQPIANGHVYPKVISYTTNTNAGDEHIEYRVEFVTADKGYPVVNGKRSTKRQLEAINIWYLPSSGPAELVRKLEFEYETNLANGSPTRYRHWLTQIKLVDGSGANLPPTDFTYEERRVGNYWYDTKANTAWAWRPFLKTVSNGYKGKVEFNYAIASVYGHLFQVVDTRLVTDEITGLSGSYEYHYGEANLRWPGGVNSYGNFYGFGRVTVVDPLNNVTRRYFDTYYDPWAFPHNRGGEGILNGKELSAWVYAPGGTALYSVSTSNWRQAQQSNWVYFVYNQSQSDYLCDGKPTNGSNNEAYFQNCAFHKTVFTYDTTRGNLTKEEEHGGIEGSSSKLYRYTEYAYTALPTNNSNLISLPSAKTLYTAGGSKVAETLYRYDEQNQGAAPTFGNLTRERAWAGSDNYRDTAYGDYDAYGNPRLTTVYNSYGSSGSLASGSPQTTTTTYGEHGLLPVKVSNMLGHETETAYDYRFHKPKWEEEANNARTEYSYDDFGRLTQVKLPNCSEAVFKASYLDSGISASSPYRELVEQNVGQCGQNQYAQTYVYYDGLGRKLQSRSSGDSGNFIVAELRYDPLGRVVETSVPHAESGGGYQAPSWSGLATTETIYDVLGRPTQVTEPNNQVTKSFYQWYDTAVIDPKKGQKISSSDPLGRLVQVKEFKDQNYTEPVWDDSVDALTSYVYDAQDNLTGVTDAANNQTSITYDALGRKTSMDDPDMGQWYYHYDPLGNLVAQVDAQAQAVDLYYDSLNRLVGKVYQPGPVGNPAGYQRPNPPVSYTVAYGYDESGHGAGLSRRTSMSDAGGSVNWHYDLRGRVLTETRLFSGSYSGLSNSQDGGGSGAYSIGYGYNEADWLIRQSYPDGEVVTTTYTTRGLPQSLAGSSLPGGGSAGYISSAVYNALGDLDTRTAANGVLADYDYYTSGDNLNRLKRLRVTKGGSTWLDLQYNSYDPVGNIQKIYDASLPGGGQTLQFSYDHLDRLAHAWSSGNSLAGFSHYYTYDPIGNLTQKTVDGQILNYTYSPGQPHAVTQVATNTYQYDANGNMSLRLENGVAYTQTWTVENKLKRVVWQENGQPYTTTFVYDGDNNRLLEIEQTPAGGEITTVYIGQLYEERFETSGLGASVASLAAPPATDLAAFQGNGGNGTGAGVEALAGEGVAGNEGNGGNGGQTVSLPPAAEPALTGPLALKLPLGPLPPLEPVQTPGQAVLKLAGLASPLLLPEKWANTVIDYAVGGGNPPLQNPAVVVGSNNNTYVNLGYYGGYIIVDMGPGEEAVCNRAGLDLRVFEDNHNEDFKVWGANDPAGPWRALGARLEGDADENGNGDGFYIAPGAIEAFDFEFSAYIADTNYAAYRYLKIESLETGGSGGPDIDAIQALNMCPLWPITPTITSPVSGTAVSGVSVSVSGTADSLMPIEVYRNGSAGPVATPTSSSSNTWSTSVSGLQPGKNTLTARAHIGSRVSGSAEVIIYRDGQVPTTTITLPATNNQWLRGTSSFEGSAGDDNAQLDLLYKLNTDTGWKEPYKDQPNSFEWEIPIVTTVLTNGLTYTFTVNARDITGQMGTDKTRTFKVDNLPPAPSLTMAATQYTQTLSLTWSATEQHSGVATYTLGLLTQGQVEPTVIYTGSATAISYTVPSGGYYTFTLKAIDLAGNTTSQWQTKAITVDLAVPSVINYTPDGPTNDTTPFISGQFKASGGPVNTGNVQISLDGGGGQNPDNVSTSGFDLTPSSLSEGLHTVQVTADNAAGQGQTEWSFFVDSQVPTVTLTAGPSGPTSLLVSWPGSDASPSSGISSYDVQYKIGSDNWTDWLTNTTETSALFQATLAQTYTFQARVRDNAGNVSGWVETGVVEVSPVTKYYLFGGQRVAMRQGSQVYYLHGDHLGSTSLTTDANGNVVAQVRYLPYGEERWGTGALPTDFGFTGQRSEPGFGLMDYNARYYSPGLGRFISPDTVVPEEENPQHWNRYSYTYNNPLKFVDPTGHCGEVFMTEDGEIIEDPCEGGGTAAGMVPRGGGNPGGGPMGRGNPISGGVSPSGSPGIQGPVSSSPGSTGPIGPVGNPASGSGTGAVNPGSTGSSSPGSPGLPGAGALNNAQLVDKVAQKAWNWGRGQGLGQGPRSGTLMHQYAKNLLDRFQKIFGSRNLQTEIRYVNGQVWRPGMSIRGSVRLDVVEGNPANPTHVFDYKFGYNNRGLTPAREAQIRRVAGLQQNIPIDEVSKP